MLTPEDVQKLDQMSDSKISKLISNIDRSIKHFHGDYPWEYALIDGEYPTPIMDAILKQYFDAGWKYIYWGKSSEHDERPGITDIMLSTSPIDSKYVNDHHCYTNI